jgi:hypothetical protein
MIPPLHLLRSGVLMTLCAACLGLWLALVWWALQAYP